LDGKKWEQIEGWVSEVYKIFWNNAFYIITNQNVYSSKDGKDWYSFKHKIGNGYYGLNVSYFKNENIVLCFDYGELYISNDLKKVKTIKNPFNDTSSSAYSFFICNNTVIIYYRGDKKIVYWSYLK